MIEPGRASDGLVHLLDLFATCLTLAGAEDALPTRPLPRRRRPDLVPPGRRRRGRGGLQPQVPALLAHRDLLGVAGGRVQVHARSSITDDDTDVLNPGGFTGAVQRYGYGRLFNLYLDPKETRSYMIRKLVYIDAIIAEIARHRRTFREWPNKPAAPASA